MKKCPTCKESKPRDEFNKHAANKDGLGSQCRACRKAHRERNIRVNPRRPYINETRPSVYDGAIEVKLYGKNDLWTILDIEDFERLHDFRFYLRSGYAAINPEVKYVSLHKVIVDYPVVDHINRDKLDNRKCNLRSVTQGQNCMNRSMRSDNISGYKGVYWYKRDQKWQAQIMINGRSKSLGRFVDILDAARSYDKAAIEHFGDFAVLNFPLEVV